MSGDNATKTSIKSKQAEKLIETIALNIKKTLELKAIFKWKAQAKEAQMRKFVEAQELYLDLHDACHE